jgi:ABC-type nitrate/sulfonate/bicarbonate transport system substrate-binding protein
MANFGHEVKMLYTGLAMAKKLLDDRADLVKRFLRATAKGREFYKNFKEETLRLAKKYDRNPDDARTADYDITLEMMTKDGTEDLATQKSDIEVGLRNLGMPTTVPVERVFDFRLITEAYKELHASKWKPELPGKRAGL